MKNNYIFQNALETDFEIGHYLKERIIPRAVLYYTGENNDDDIESDESDSLLEDESDMDDNENPLRSPNRNELH